MFCTRCGSEISDGVSFCNKCGCPTNNNMIVPPPYNNYYYGMTPINNNVLDKADSTVVAVSVLIPLIGIIMGIVSYSQNKPKSGAAYLAAGVIAMMVYGVILGILGSL